MISAFYVTLDVVWYAKLLHQMRERSSPHLSGIGAITTAFFSAPCIKAAPGRVRFGNLKGKFFARLFPERLLDNCQPPTLNFCLKPLAGLGAQCGVGLERNYSESTSEVKRSVVTTVHADIKY